MSLLNVCRILSHLELTEIVQLGTEFFYRVDVARANWSTATEQILNRLERDSGHGIRVD